MNQINLKSVSSDDVSAIASKEARTLVLGTRGSKLALWQSNWIAEKLKAHRPNLKIELKIITTQGDRIQDRPLQSVNDDGFFVREIEDNLLRGDIDLAVHSLKDLPHAQPAGLVVPVVPGREDARDALLSREGNSLDDLPQGAKVGTCSTRRASQLLAYRPDLQILPLRGNVDTRIRKLMEGDNGIEYDAIVLAASGLERLGRGSEITQKLPFKLMLPAPGQGALAPECRANDRAVLGALATLNDREAQIEVECEKAFMAALGGGCQTPVGCYAEVIMRKFVVRGYVGRPDGSHFIKVELVEDYDGSLNQARKLGASLAEAAKAQGASQILDEARAQGYITPRA